MCEGKCVRESREYRRSCSSPQPLDASFACPVSGPRPGKLRLKPSPETRNQKPSLRPPIAIPMPTPTPIAIPMPIAIPIPTPIPSPCPPSRAHCPPTLAAIIHDKMRFVKQNLKYFLDSSDLGTLTDFSPSEGRRGRDEVHVVRHQTPCPAQHAVPLRRGAHQLQIAASVSVREGDLLARRTALCYVVREAGDHNSRKSGHGWMRVALRLTSTEISECPRIRFLRPGPAYPSVTPASRAAAIRRRKLSRPSSGERTCSRTTQLSSGRWGGISRSMWAQSVCPLPKGTSPM